MFTEVVTLKLVHRAAFWSTNHHVYHTSVVCTLFQHVSVRIRATAQY